MGLPTDLEALILVTAWMHYERVKLRRFVLAPLLGLIACMTSIAVPIVYYVSLFEALASAAMCRNGPFGGPNDPCDQVVLDSTASAIADSTTFTPVDKAMFLASFLACIGGCVSLLMRGSNQSRPSRNEVRLDRNLAA